MIIGGDKARRAMENTIVIERKAQIALDTLKPQERTNILNTIKGLEHFPEVSSSLYREITNKENYFIARTNNLYRIVFYYQKPQITIVDIFNRKAIKNLFNV
jgi:mRNA-degrading endonuclease RelE of RelBE toxin-antitoxin system